MRSASATALALTEVGVLLAASLTACSSGYTTGAEGTAEAGAPGGGTPDKDGGNGSVDASAPNDGGGGPLALPECQAQRVVVILAGTGSLAWFTQIWAIPAAYDSVTGTEALDGDFHFARVSSGEHPLYARKTGGIPTVTTHGTHPLPTAMFAGSNETHTTLPNSTRSLAGKDVITLGAQRQSVLHPQVPVLTIGNAMFFTAKSPAPMNGSSASEAASIIGTAANLTPTAASALVPSQSLVNTWTGGQSYAALVAMATNLALTANAFAGGYVGTVLIPGFQDDPHDAFDAMKATPNADGLASVLDHFYETLASTPEPSCSHHGVQISLADNTLLMVIGDTYKNPFTSAGWPDGTPGNSNLLYVRSNGYLKPGFFGAVATSAPVLTNFDPTTGSLSTMASGSQSTTAALLGVYFAITRGDAMATSALSSAAYQGVVGSPLP